MTYLDKHYYSIRKKNGEVFLSRPGMSISLTAMFGRGEEPATVEEACDLIMRHTDYLWRLAYELELI